MRCGPHPLCLLGALLLLAAPAVYAQETDAPQPLPRPDTSRAEAARADTLRPGDPGLPAEEAPLLSEPAAPARSSGLKEPVQFAAQDSLVLVFDKENGDEGRLYGNAKVTYGDAALDAYRVDILFGIDELRASGLSSDTGRVGLPHFQQGQESFHGTELAFNLRTERGRAVGARTAIEDGFITGGVVKVREDSTLFIREGTYTTCECDIGETPSYSLRSSKMKIVNQKWIYTGPIQLYLFNIPTPVWLPFGFLPAQEGRRSGPLPPSYGEDERGFYLRNWGWYQAINDYMDAQVQLGLWSRGSWQVNPSFRYNRRYFYSGQLQLDYVRNRRGEQGDPDFTVFNTSSLRWNHNQTLNPTSNFSGNVNLSSSNYLRTVSEQYEDRVRQTIESSIRYNKRWTESGRNFAINLSQRQLLATGETSLTLPSVTFSQGSRKPFQRTPQGGTREQWYERLTYSYSGSLDNRYRFVPLPADSLDTLGATGISWYDALVSPSKYRLATGQEIPFDFKSSHRIPVSASFSVNRLPLINRTFRLNVSSNLNYTEDWYIQTLRKAYSDSANTVITEPEPGFFALRRFSTGVSANTTFYGLFPFRIGRFNTFRHTVRPSASFSYSPDFSSDFWGYTRHYVDQHGQEVEYGVVSDFSPLSGRRQQTLSLNVANVFETKLARRDTTGEQQLRTLKLLDVDLSTAYNFAADSLKLAPVTLSARTNILDRVDLTLRSSFSPYALDAAGTRPIDRYVFSLQDFRFARVTQLDVTARTSFRSSNARGGQPFSTPRARPGAVPPVPGDDFPPDYEDPFGSPFRNTPVGYADFAIPWSLNLDFTYGFSRPLQEVRRRANLNVSFDFNLTPRWKVQGRSGYDLIRQEFVTTNLVLLRDFDCWEMSFSWVPFGRYQSYSFDLHVKSGKLRDLLRLRQPRSDVRGRFDGLLQ